MNKIKNIFAFAIFTLLIYSCGDDNNVGITNPFADVNYEALAVSDNTSIENFLKTHYYDATSDDIKLIDAGQTAMFSQQETSIVDVTENGIAYKLYTYRTQVGVPVPVKESPTEMDSIFVNRKGFLLLENSISEDPFDSADRTWWSLAPTFGIQNIAPSPIKGWVKGFPIFKSGENKTDNGPITYVNPGKGYIFIPSGLAYPSINYQIGQNINYLFDQTLVFKVELLDIVEDTDHDNDGTPSINEDANGDEDPRNDFSDSNSPNLPDYLNPDVN
jgi:FKBP-type peptidyl-prolyl cis-trans isomerase FkpA